MLGEDTNVDKAVSVGNYLGLYFSQNQGLRLGESVVVSLKAHARMPEKRVKGQIKILLNRDAGKTYLDYVDFDQVVHLDVYHQPGEIDPQDVAQAIFRAMKGYFLSREPALQFAEEELFKLVINYARKIYVVGNQGQGLLYDLFQGVVKPYSEGEEGGDHVHILAGLNREEYFLVYVIAAAVEEVVLTAGVKLARVRNIVHGNQKQNEENFGRYIRLPWKHFRGQTAMPLPEKENVNQLILKLAEKFGGVNEIEEFMECYSTNIFKRKGLEHQKKKWGDVEQYLEQLEELGLLQNTLLGRVSTRKGLIIKEYVIKHKCELETEIRRAMRKSPGRGGGQFRKLGSREGQLTRVEFTNHNKTINDPQQNWSGDLAVPQTVIQAVKRSFRQGHNQLVIGKEDLHYYKKKDYAPINICLLIDASGSMAGDKRQAACYLAQHLLLTGKEKVGVVTFQERTSQVAVPFTRNQAVLSRGLAAINPAGLTPMASGIMTAVELIKNSRVKNPLLVMITDGIPNTPLWTYDAQADALVAATHILEHKIRFICIGIESNQYYLKKLVDQAQGVLYLVDDLNRDNLINIVHYERKVGESRGRFS